MPASVAVAQPDTASLAAQALQWQGRVVPNVQLLGDRVDVVVEIVAEEHAQRLSVGDKAFVDPRTLTKRLEEEPAFRSRAPVRVVGVLARRAKWITARRIARAYGAFGPAAAVVPLPAAGNPLTALEADWLGAGLVTVTREQVDVLVPPPAWRAPTWTWVRRYGEELVYARMLRLGLAPRSHRPQTSCQ